MPRPPRFQCSARCVESGKWPALRRANRPRTRTAGGAADCRHRCGPATTEPIPANGFRCTRSSLRIFLAVAKDVQLRLHRSDAPEHEAEQPCGIIQRPVSVVARDVLVEL